MKQSREAVLILLMGLTGGSVSADPLGGLLIGLTPPSLTDSEKCPISGCPFEHHDEEGEDDNHEKETKLPSTGFIDEPASSLIDEKEKQKERALPAPPQAAIRPAAEEEFESASYAPESDSGAQEEIQRLKENVQQSAKEKTAEAAKEALKTLRRRASSFFSTVLLWAWEKDKRAVSRAIVNKMPDHYKASDDIFKKPLPVVKTYHISTNGPVSEMMVATLCQEMVDAGVRSADALKHHCGDVVYDRAPVRF